MAGLAACASGPPDATNTVEQSALPAPPPGGIVATEANSGWTEGAFSVSSDGAAEYDLPLWVADGRGGLQPSLALHYNSRAGNGRVGVGWSITGLSSIEPCRRTPAQDAVDAAPAFTGVDAFCLDGQRLRPTQATWSPTLEYRTERDTAARITTTTPSGGGTPQPSSFTVWTKDGKKLTYGARLRAYTVVGVNAENPALQPSGAQVTAAWHLSQIADRNGNTIDIAYDTEPGTAENRWAVEFRPKEITYGPDRKVEFVYETRTEDPIDGFIAGQGGSVHVRLNSRIQTIKMWAGATLLREYGLLYETNSTTKRSRLTSVTECDGAGVCLNTLHFEWSLGSWRHEELLLQSMGDVGSSTSEYRYLTGDVDGDGGDDFVYYNPNAQSSPPTPFESWLVRFSNKVNGFGPATMAGIPRVISGMFPQVRPVDYDRDGRMDLLVEVANGNSWNFKLYRATGGATPYTAYLPTVFDSVPVTGGSILRAALFADIDGNGRPDYLALHPVSGPNGSTRYVWSHRLNTEDGFNQMVETSLASSVPPPFENFHFRVLPRGGQRAAEILSMRYDVGTIETGDYRSVKLVSGSLLNDFDVNLPFNNRVGDFPNNPDRRNLQFADINGDGLDDAVYPLSDGLKVQLNSGSGFSDVIDGLPGYNAPPDPADGYDLPVRIGDFSGDGAADILVLRRGHEGQTGPDPFAVYTWRGGGFVQGALTADPDVMQITGPSGPPLTQNIQVLDFNGDGALDIAQQWPFAVGPQGMRLYKRLGGMPDRMIRVKASGLGTTACSNCRVEIDYKTLATRTYYTPCNNASYPDVCIRAGGSVVAIHRVANGIGQTIWNEFKHHYSGARFDVKGRGWLGFDSHTVSTMDDSVKTETKFEQSNSRCFFDTLTYAYPWVNLPTKVTTTIVDGSGVEYERTYTSAHVCRPRDTLDGNVPRHYAVVPVSTSGSDRERPAGGAWTELHAGSVVFSNHDSFGHAQQVKTRYPGISELVVDLEYDNDTTNWFIGRLKKKTTKDCLLTGNECETRTTSRRYEPTTGNLETVVIEPDDATLRLTTTVRYGSYGNVSDITSTATGGVCTDNAGCESGYTCEQGVCTQNRTMSFAYDERDLYPTSATDALGHVSRMNMDPGLGVALDAWDANGVPTTRKFDGFGRLREVNRADGSFERYTTSGPLIHITTVPDGLGGTLQRGHVVLDKLGRPVEERTLAFGGGVSATTTRYDVLGRVVQRSRPFLADSDETPVYTTYTYDRRDRLKSVVDSDGATLRHDYLGLATHTHDAKGNHSYIVERADGKIASRVEDASGSALTTRYAYKPFGLLGTVTAADDTVQGIQYDRLGRRTALVDPSAGTTTTKYNPFGEVIREVNGAGEARTFAHDILGRVSSATSIDGTATYTWDATGQRGRLSTARGADGVLTTYGYDDIGRPANTTWNIEGIDYTVSLDYDTIGRANTLTYPALPGPQSRSTVRYRYTPTGYLEQVEDAASGTPYWRVNERNIAGQLASEVYGSGAGAVTDTRTYSPVTGLLTTIQSDGPGGQLDKLEYDYDLAGNVKLRKDLVGQRAKSQEFLYDALNRMTTWKFSDATTTVTGSFSYSALGNLLGEAYEGRPGQNVTYTYGENGAPPHAVTRRGASGIFTYDGGGRQRTGPSRTVTYNHVDLPRTITRNGQTTSFVYDAAGARVLKRDPSQTTITIAGIFERRVGADAKNIHYIVADGRAVAQVTRSQATPTGPVTGTEVLYLHSDGQGSITQTTSASGAVVEEFFYDPFGRRTDNDYRPLAPESRAIGQGYTGHHHDDELGLINMKGRLYDPLLRRFLTADPIVHPLASQSLNRYSYALNNPATFTDPTGFQIRICKNVRGGDCGTGGGSGQSEDDDGGSGRVPGSRGGGGHIGAGEDGGTGGHGSSTGGHGGGGSPSGAGKSDEAKGTQPLSWQDRHREYFETHTFTIPCGGPVPCMGGASGTIVLGGLPPTMADERVFETVGKLILATAPIWVPIVAGVVVGTLTANPGLGVAVTAILNGVQARSEGEALAAAIPIAGTGSRVAVNAERTVEAVEAAFGSASRIVSGAPRSGQILNKIAGVNPTGCMTNCGEVALATHARIIGSNPAAVAPATGPMSLGTMVQYTGVAPTGPLSARDLARTLIAKGDGSSAIVGGIFKQRVWVVGPNGAAIPMDGHFFNAFNQRQVIYFVDGQSGTFQILTPFARFWFFPMK